MTFPSSPFSPFDDARILHHDDDVIVVDKPAGLSLQSPEAEGGDLVARLREHLRDVRGIADPYLAVHEYIDRDVSGAIALSRRPLANHALATAAKNRSNRCVWSALIEGDPPKPRGSARVSLARGKNGTILPSSARHGAFSQTIQWTLLRSNAARHLLAVTADGSSARHIRAALSALRMPVAGDTAFRGPIAPRLMLHASRMELKHPDGSTLCVEAALPASLEWWLSSPGPDTMPPFDRLRAMLLDSAAARYPLARRGVEAFRLFHGEGEGIPGFDLDRIQDYLVAWIGEQFDDESRRRTLDAADSLGFKGVYMKVRPRHASRIVDSRRPDIAPASAVRGADGPQELIVDEGGCRFVMRPGDGLSTGLFLDQRENRRWIAERCQGRSVLNLFAYTCSFTVAAARAGAVSSVSVDASARVLELGHRNLEVNGISLDRHVLVNDDVSTWLPAARRAGRRFDVVVLDPPSFSTTHRSRFVVAEDLPGIAEHCMGVLSESGGVILACTNNRSLRMARLRGAMQEAAARAGRTIERAQELPAAPDFPVMPGAEPHMKALAVHVAPMRGA